MCCSSAQLLMCLLAARLFCAMTYHDGIDLTGIAVQVVLCGQSYDATAALSTASLQHSAVKGCVALYPFW